jgi:CAAX protease family protein
MSFIIAPVIKAQLFSFSCVEDYMNSYIKEMNMANTTAQSSWLRRMADRLPVLFSLGVILIAGLLTEIPLDRLFDQFSDPPAPEFWRVLIGHTITGLLLIWLLARMGMVKSARFTPVREWRAVWLVWPLAVVALMNLEGVLTGTLVLDTSRPWLFLLFALMTLSIGFAEEVMARSVVLVVLLNKWGQTRKGIYLSVIVSGLLFGAAHLFNMISGHRTPLSTLTQMIYSVFFGVCFAACFLRNKSIWPVLFMHAAIDFAGGLRHLALDPVVRDAVPQATFDSFLVSVAITLPLLIYGLIVLRKVTPEDVIVE